jgi:hypothetical protein
MLNIVSTLALRNVAKTPPAVSVAYSDSSPAGLLADHLTGQTERMVQASAFGCGHQPRFGQESTEPC